MARDTPEADLPLLGLGHAASARNIGC